MPIDIDNSNITAENVKEAMPAVFAIAVTIVGHLLKLGT
jgi:hypothetical protein